MKRVLLLALLAVGADPLFGQEKSLRFFSGKVTGLLYNDVWKNVFDEEVHIFIEADKTNEQVLSNTVTNEIPNKNKKSLQKLKYLWKFLRISQAKIL